MTVDAVQITEADVRKLAKMLGLLGSASVGERAAAALKAHEWVTSRGILWEELLIPPDLGTVSVTVGGQAPPAPPNYQTAQASAAPYANAAQAPAHLPPWAPLIELFTVNFGQMVRNPREHEFLASQAERAKLYGLRTRLSDKQEAWLRDILGRAGMTW